MPSIYDLTMDSISGGSRVPVELSRSSPLIANLASTCPEYRNIAIVAA